MPGDAVALHTQRLDSARHRPALVSAMSGAELPVRPSPPGCHNGDRRIASSQRLASKHEARGGQLHRRGSAAGRRVCGEPLTIGFIRGTRWAG